MKNFNYKIGNLVRLINNENLYRGSWLEPIVKRPDLYGIYKVRGFSATGSLLLEGVNNIEIYCEDYGKLVEPGFHQSRFQPYIVSHMAESDKLKEVIGVSLKKESVKKTKLKLESILE